MWRTVPKKPNMKLLPCYEFWVEEGLEERNRRRRRNPRTIGVNTIKEEEYFRNEEGVKIFYGFAFECI